MIIIGMTACGKTHYLIQELKTTFFHQFENIFLICPTYVLPARSPTSFPPSGGSAKIPDCYLIRCTVYQSKASISATPVVPVAGW
jgi:hypothetical protein